MVATPVLILPGLLEDADAFQHQVEGLRESAVCRVADLTRADTIGELARQALGQAPEGRFALAGHSMGGYVALEIMRQAPQRIDRLALLNTHARADSPEAAENRRRLMALAIGKDAFLKQQRAIIARIDSRPHLGKIACPTLVIAARQDALMPLELLEELAHGIPQATLGIVEDSGHMASIEQPGKMTDLLRAWLQG